MDDYLVQYIALMGALFVPYHFINHIVKLLHIDCHFGRYNKVIRYISVLVCIVVFCETEYRLYRHDPVRLQFTLYTHIKMLYNIVLEYGERADIQTCSITVLKMSRDLFRIIY
jgi:hypothetical protein